MGEWTIKVSDQGSSSNNGSFLGWNMVFWGSAIDPSKTTLFDVPQDEVDVVLPPYDSPPPSPTMSAVTSTKQHAKPTAHLPGDHGDAAGENTNATFPGQEDTAVPNLSPSPSASHSPTADEGWFSDMSNLVKSQAWFFGAIGMVVVFGLAAGLYFWRRRVLRLRNYRSLPEGDELPMSGVRGGRLSGGPRTKELYDAFGEVSDDDEDDADEQTRLRSGYEDDHRVGGSRGGPAQYRDEPEGGASHSRAEGAASPDKGSDGSWEHAS